MEENDESKIFCGSFSLAEVKKIMSTRLSNRIGVFPDQTMKEEGEASIFMEECEAAEESNILSSIGLSEVDNSVLFEAENVKALKTLSNKVIFKSGSTSSICNTSECSSTSDGDGELRDEEKSFVIENTEASLKKSFCVDKSVNPLDSNVKIIHKLSDETILHTNAEKALVSDSASVINESILSESADFDWSLKVSRVSEVNLSDCDTVNNLFTENMYCQDNISDLSIGVSDNYITKDVLKLMSENSTPVQSSFTVGKFQKSENICSSQDTNCNEKKFRNESFSSKSQESDLSFMAKNRDCSYDADVSCSSISFSELSNVSGQSTLGVSSDSSLIAIDEEVNSFNHNLNRQVSTKFELNKITNNSDDKFYGNSLNNNVDSAKQENILINTIICNDANRLESECEDYTSVKISDSVIDDGCKLDSSNSLSYKKNVLPPQLCNVSIDIEKWQCLNESSHSTPISSTLIKPSLSENSKSINNVKDGAWDRWITVRRKPHMEASDLEKSNSLNTLSFNCKNMSASQKSNDSLPKNEVCEEKAYRVSSLRGDESYKPPLTYQLKTSSVILSDRYASIEKAQVLSEDLHATFMQTKCSFDEGISSEDLPEYSDYAILTGKEFELQNNDSSGRGDIQTATCYSVPDIDTGVNLKDEMNSFSDESTLKATSGSSLSNVDISVISIDSSPNKHNVLNLEQKSGPKEEEFKFIDSSNVYSVGAANSESDASDSDKSFVSVQEDSDVSFKSTTELNACNQNNLFEGKEFCGNSRQVIECDNNKLSYTNNNLSMLHEYSPGSDESNYDSLNSSAEYFSARESSVYSRSCSSYCNESAHKLSVKPLTEKDSTYKYKNFDAKLSKSSLCNTSCNTTKCLITQKKPFIQKSNNYYKDSCIFSGLDDVTPYMSPQNITFSHGNDDDTMNISISFSDTSDNAKCSVTTNNSIISNGIDDKDFWRSNEVETADDDNDTTYNIGQVDAVKVLEYSSSTSRNNTKTDGITENCTSQNPDYYDCLVFPKCKIKNVTTGIELHSCNTDETTYNTGEVDAAKSLESLPSESCNTFETNDSTKMCSSENICADVKYICWRRGTKRFSWKEDHMTESGGNLISLSNSAQVNVVKSPFSNIDAQSSPKEIYSSRNVSVHDGKLVPQIVKLEKGKRKIYINNSQKNLSPASSYANDPKSSPVLSNSPKCSKYNTMQKAQRKQVLPTTKFAVVNSKSTGDREKYLNNYSSQNKDKCASPLKSPKKANKAAASLNKGLNNNYLRKILSPVGEYIRNKPPVLIKKALPKLVQSSTWRNNSSCIFTVSKGLETIQENSEVEVTEEDYNPPVNARYTNVPNLGLECAQEKWMNKGPWQRTASYGPSLPFIRSKGGDITLVEVPAEEKLPVMGPKTKEILLKPLPHVLYHTGRKKAKDVSDKADVSVLVYKAKM